MNQLCENSFIEHILSPDTYQPVIDGHIDELIQRLERLSYQVPNSAKVFSKILLRHRDRHPLLEDWLIIPIYLYIWEEDFDKLKWTEARFVELADSIDQLTWSAWVDEFICQTDCITTHRIADRIYDYLLHLYGALYLIREGWRIQLLPMQGGGPDIKAIRGNELCVMECKFKHVSTKFASLFWRFDAACHSFLQKQNPVVFCEDFIFPGAKDMKELLLKHFIVAKQFISKVYQHSKIINRGVFEDLKFEYNPEPEAATTIDSQSDYAMTSARTFSECNLSRILKSAAKQLGKSEFGSHQKILFLGLQHDSFYMSPWTESGIKDIKPQLYLEAQQKYGIKIVFSEDVNFSVKEYL